MPKSKKHGLAYNGSTGSQDGGAATYNTVTRYPVYFTPGVHNPRIVASNHSHNIYALGFELLELLDIWRDVVGLASGSESAYEQLPDQLRGPCRAEFSG